MSTRKYINIRVMELRERGSFMRYAVVIEKGKYEKMVNLDNNVRNIRTMV